MSSPSTSPQPDAEVPARQTATQRRQADILALLREHGTLAVADLPDRYRVSAETIRRDLRHLEEVRAVTRSYGQVRVVDSGAFETDLTFRESHLVEEKLRIANAAATHLAQAETVFLDEGHLPTLLGRALPQDRALTIVTTNLRAATELSQHPPFTVITVGGRVRRSTLGVTGRWAAAMLRQVEPDLAFLGANAVTADGWLTTPEAGVAEVKETVLANARRTVFVAGHEKFGRSTFVRFGHVRDVERVITGRELRESTARHLHRLGAQVERV